MYGLRMERLAGDLTSIFMARDLMLESTDFQLQSIKHPTRKDIRDYRHRVDERWADANLGILVQCYDILPVAETFFNYNDIRYYPWLINPGISMYRGQIQHECDNRGIDFEEFKSWIVHSSIVMPALTVNDFNAIFSDKQNTDSGLVLYDWINEYN